MQNKTEMRLPIVAFMLTIAPFLLLALTFAHQFFVWPFLFSFFAPVVGIIMGFVALFQGKSRIGVWGMIFSGFAIVLPIAFIVTMIILFRTGVMMLG